MRRAVSVAVVLLVLAAVSLAETKIGPKGQVIVDGKAVIPLAMWCQPPYLYEYHRQLGMNCMVGSHTERGAFRDQGPTIFPAAEKQAMRLVCEYRASSRGQPGIIGWIGPNLAPGNPDEIKEGNARIRREDPQRFVMNNLPIHEFLAGGQDDYYRQVLKETDALISHVWPEVQRDKPNLRNVALMVDRVRELSKDRPGGEVSIWPDINPHQWSNKKKRAVEAYPAPTEGELRFQIWLALIHGADAICFFPISFDPFVYCQIPAKNEQELAWNTRLIERMTPALTADESPLAITVTSDREGGLIDMTTRTTDNKHYVFLVNGQRDEQTVTLTVPGLGKDWTFRDAVAEKAVEASGDKLTEKLPGLALRIWELAPVVVSAGPRSQDSPSAGGTAQ